MLFKCWWNSIFACGSMSENCLASWSYQLSERLLMLTAVGLILCTRPAVWWRIDSNAQNQHRMISCYFSVSSNVQKTWSRTYFFSIAYQNAPKTSTSPTRRTFSRVTELRFGKIYDQLFRLMVVRPVHSVLSFISAVDERKIWCQWKPESCSCLTFQNKGYAVTSFPINAS